MRGKKWVDWADSHGFTCANDPSQPTRIQGRVCSSPDAAFFRDAVVNWFTAGCAGTDHLPIVCDVTFPLHSVRVGAESTAAAPNGDNEDVADGEEPPEEDQPKG